MERNDDGILFVTPLFRWSFLYVFFMYFSIQKHISSSILGAMQSQAFVLQQ